MSAVKDAPPAPAATGPIREGGSARRWWRVDPRYLVLAAASVIVAYLALVPLGTMVVASLRTTFLGTGGARWTLHNYVRTFTAPGFGPLVADSFEYALATAAAAVVLGFALAWLVTRTNTPAKGFARIAALVPLIIPGILNTVAWALLFSPQTGPLNQLLRDLHLPVFDIYSILGMVFVQTTHMTPVAYLMGTAAFTSMDSSLEEAALGSGAAPLRVLRTVTLPLVRPAILSAALLMFIQTISTFEVPQLLGVPNHTFVFVSRMYAAIQAFPTDYGTVAVLGVFVLALAAVGLGASQWLARRSPTQTVTGKAFRPKTTDLGRWRWAALAAFVLFFLVTVVLPLAMLLWSSLLPGYRPPSLAALRSVSLHNYATLFATPALLGAVRNTVVTAVGAGVIVTVLTAVVAYLTTKTRMRGRTLLDGLATVPIAVPGIVLGVGVLYWYLAAPLPFHLYGTLAILVIAFVTIGLPYGMRYLGPGFAQIHDELEEAATASGASWFHSFRRIYAPLLTPSLLAAFLYTTIVAFREISAAIFLYTQNTDVMSVEIYNLWSSGDYPVVAALGIVMVLLLCLVVGAVRLLGRRVGIDNR
jgi:iron(III) transport system permease protein